MSTELPPKAFGFTVVLYDRIWDASPTVLPILSRLLMSLNDELVRPFLDAPLLDEQVLNNDLNRVRADIDAPAEPSDRVVHDALPRVALCLERESSDGAPARDAVAGAHRDRVGRVEDVRYEVVWGWGEGKVESLGGE